MKTKISTLLLLLTMMFPAFAALASQDHKTPVDAITKDGTEFELVRPEVIIHRLAPTTPLVADFEEMAPIALVDAGRLAPVTPAVAAFEEAVPDGMIQVSSIAPATPAEADFAE